MVLVEELKEADVPVREVARCDRRFDVQQVRQRLAEIAQVDSGEQGTLLLRIDGLTVGLVQPGPQRDVAAVKALKDVEADIAARQEHQGVVFFSMEYTSPSFT